jgi:hypothetical protein
MRFFNFNKTVIAGAFGLVALLGTTEITNAQTRRDDQKQQRVQSERARVEAERARAEAERVRLEQLRQEQLRQEQLNNRNRNVYSNDNRSNNNRSNNNRYRVYRNGSYYQTDSRGAELLKQAVNRGYQEGFKAGQLDRRNRRNGGYNNSSIYRSGNTGYQSYVDRSQYQYYFQQGFQKGYEDGLNSRNNYGTNRNGSVSILGSILQTILNIREN